MTCGNPICKYEFCWLCMNEAVPNHFDYGPCAGKQFFDPDSLEYKFQMSHPKLFCFYSIFKCIFSLIFFIVVFLCVPAFGLSLFAFEVIISNDRFRESFSKKYMKYVMFMSVFCYSLCIQSIIYMLWGIIFSSLAIIISIFILAFSLFLIKTILKLLLCCWLCPSENHRDSDININIKDEEIGLGNEINEMRNNHNNRKF